MVLFLLVFLVVLVLAVPLIIYILEEVGCRQADNLSRKPQHGRGRRAKAEPRSGEAGGDGWSVLRDTGSARDNRPPGDVIDMFEAKKRLQKKKQERRRGKWQPADRERGPYSCPDQGEHKSSKSPKPGPEDD